MEIAVLKSDGKKSSKKVQLSEAVFGIEPNDHAIYLDVKQHLANQRQGTHKSKERNEISGSTRKLKRQKGTGGARAGSIKNPEFRGGGRIFGPRPRDYSFKLNIKVKRLARASALTYKAKENNIIVVEDFTFGAAKTKDYNAFLGALELKNKKSLVVVGEKDKNLHLASRNIPGTKVVVAKDLNTYDILNAASLVLTENSVKAIENLLSK
ncbi:MAG: 50S ribosomal protein L4 [Bacteroidia bacterium]|nr:50S ribosomal protein L4 [Bacteroidia bacterium]